CPHEHAHHWPRSRRGSQASAFFNASNSHVGGNSIKPNRYYYKIHYKLLDSKQWTVHQSAYRSLRHAKEVAVSHYNEMYNILVVRYEVGTGNTKIVWMR